jgi:hypothetical protein
MRKQNITKFIGTLWRIPVSISKENNELVHFDKSLIHEKYGNIVISAEKFLTGKKWRKDLPPTEI